MSQNKSYRFTCHPLCYFLFCLSSMLSISSFLIPVASTEFILQPKNELWLVVRKTLVSRTMMEFVPTSPIPHTHVCTHTHPFPLSFQETTYYQVTKMSYHGNRIELSCEFSFQNKIDPKKSYGIVSLPLTNSEQSRYWHNYSSPGL